jgi:hypothetical protein
MTLAAAEPTATIALITAAAALVGAVVAGLLKPRGVALDRRAHWAEYRRRVYKRLLDAIDQYARAEAPPAPSGRSGRGYTRLFDIADPNPADDPKNTSALSTAPATTKRD